MDLRTNTHTHKLTHSQMPAHTNSRAVDRGNGSTRDDSSRKSMLFSGPWSRDKGNL